jgi:N6-adenosine-specific RNA methylase IME4
VGIRVVLDQVHAQFESGPFAGLPRGHYRVAYADPPWRFHAWSHRGEKKGACQHYQTRELDEICALPVGELMAPDAALFLWVTQPMVPEALRVLCAWNFEYRTVAFVWIKMPPTWSEGLFPLRIRPRLGLGYHTRSGSEQCWLAIRGKGYKRQSQGVEQVLHAPIREHSRKPDAFRTRINELVGNIPKIELFARARVPNWHSWGLETDKFGGAL